MEELNRVCISVGYQVYPNDFDLRTVYTALCSHPPYERRLPKLIHPYVPYVHSGDPSMQFYLYVGLTFAGLLFLAYLLLVVVSLFGNRGI